MHICITRFNDKTLLENTRFRQINNIPCIYGCPVKITDTILPNAELLVIEMNNSKNRIEGIGFIIKKAELDGRKKYKIYEDNNYNRFTYKSTSYISKTSFTTVEQEHITNLENLLFYTSRHCKRGHGIQLLPKHIINNKDFNYKKFIVSIYNNRL